MAWSFTSAFIGIALAEGRIDSIGDPITKYLPGLGLARRAFLQHHPSWQSSLVISASWVAE